jgi:hypothetical protein
MKKLFFMAVVMAVLSSCSSEEEVMENDLGKGGRIVTVSFMGDHLPVLKSVSDFAKSEEWEKELQSVTIFAFRQDRECIFQRNFTAGEIAARTITFTLPSILPGDLVYFYAVANTAVPKIWYLYQLEALKEMFPEQYNGVYEEVTTRARRSRGFVMSGQKEKVMAGAGQTTFVEISLKRTVAKIRVDVNVTAEFYNKYGGSFSVLELEIQGTPVSTSIIDYGVPIESEPVELLTQKPCEIGGNQCQSLFYVFENGERSGDEQVRLKIRGGYDVDSNSLNRIPQTYNLKLDIDPQGGGIIRRNGYYIINVNINGLAASDVELSVSVADWEGSYYSEYEID